MNLLILAVLAATSASSASRPSVGVVPLSVSGGDMVTVNEEFRQATFRNARTAEWLAVHSLVLSDPDAVIKAATIGARAGKELVLVGEVLYRGLDASVTIHLVDVKRAVVLGTTREAGCLQLKEGWANRATSLLLGGDSVMSRVEGVGTLVGRSTATRKSMIPAELTVDGQFTGAASLRVEVSRQMECLEEPVTVTELDAPVRNPWDFFVRLLAPTSAGGTVRVTFTSVGEGEATQCWPEPADGARVTVLQGEALRGTGSTEQDGAVTLWLDGPLGYPPMISVRAALNEDEATATVTVPFSAMLAQLSPTDATLPEIEAFAAAFPEARLPEALERRRRSLVEAVAAQQEEARQRLAEQATRDSQAEQHAQARRAAAAEAWSRVKPTKLKGVQTFIAEFGEAHVPPAALALRDKLLLEAEAALLELVGDFLKSDDPHAALAMVQVSATLGVPTSRARAVILDALSRILGLAVGPPIARRRGGDSGAEFHAMRSLFGYGGKGFTGDDFFESLARAERGEVVTGGLKAFVAPTKQLSPAAARITLLSMLSRLGVPASPALVDDIYDLTADGSP